MTPNSKQKSKEQTVMIFLGLTIMEKIRHCSLVPQNPLELRVEHSGDDLQALDDPR